ncbi:MAG: hypothetical protein IIA44_03990, partial [Acidobacteria bacterium]|nr:hypothetical protein [Acidobacteriota bacterium]
GEDVPLINCTFANNSAGERGGAIQYDESVDAGDLTNCILWGNTAPVGPEIFNDLFTNVNVNYSDVQGGWTGAGGIGNIAADPRFVDADDLRLLAGSPAVDSARNGDVPVGITTDLAGEPRFIDDPNTPDCPQPGADCGTPPIVDMGAYEYFIDCNQNHIPDWVDIANGTSQDCNGTGIPDECELEEDCNYNGIPDDCDVDDDGDGIPDDCLLGLAGEITPPPSIAALVDFARTAEDLDNDGFPDAVVPPTAAFYQPTENKLYGNEPGSMTVNWLDDHGQALLPEPTPYSISAIPHAADNVIGTNYFLDQQVGSAAAGVPIESPFTVTIHLNATIREADPNKGETLDDAYIQQGTNAFQVSDDVVPGWVVLEYTDQVSGGPLRGFEVVHIRNLGFVNPEEVAIGRKVTLPQDADECRAMLIANGDANGEVAWHRGAGVENAADIWPIRPLTNANLFRVIWYRQSLLGNGEDLGNCWPVAVSAHTTRWPNPALGDAPVQIHVLDTSDASRVPIVDLRIKKGTEESDLYCDGSVEYQEGFTAGDPSPGTVIDDDGFFTAAKEGYSVIRFTQPEGDGSCGIGTALPTTFEVVGSFDHLDAGAIASSRAAGVVPVFAGTFDTVIGTSIENAAEHRFDTPHYPYGYLHDGLGYAVTTYEPLDALAQPNPDYTGQIIPVNVSSFPDGANAHGLLEVWYFQESRATDNGDYAGGIFWPNRVYRYDADWPVTTEQIVIADQDGAPCDDQTYCPDGAYPPTSEGSKIYAVGTFEPQVDEELNVAGWNPNDEHAILHEGHVYAVRDDNPWSVGTGHPYVLVQYPIEFDPNDGTMVTKWAMGVHEVIADNAGADPRCPWNGDLANFDCFVYGEGQAGSPIDPPLFPVNNGASPCLDETGAPLTTWNFTGTWVDRNGLAWAVEQWADTCLDDDPGLCSQSEGQILLYENWATSGEGCQPWREYGTGVPTPVTYLPTWPSVIADDCGTDPDCAPLLTIGQTMIDSPVAVANQCGRIKLLHDSVNIKVIDRELWTAIALSAVVAQNLDFSKLPPHLANGELSGGLGDVPDRVEYDLSSEELRFRGVMSVADRDYIIAMADLTRAGCDPDPTADPICDAVYALYDLSREQLFSRCLGGINDGLACTIDGHCPAVTRCLGGTFDFDECTNIADCESLPDGVCQNTKVCVSGLDPGAKCIEDSDCPDDIGTCTIFKEDNVCVGGALDGNLCQSDSQCPPLVGTCELRSECDGGINDGFACTIDGDCPDGLCQEDIIPECVSGGGAPTPYCVQDSDCDTPNGLCLAVGEGGVCEPNTQQIDHVVSVADAAAKPGWITLALQNDDFCTGSPVSVEVFRVDCGIDGPFPGRIQVIEAKCPFSEEFVLRHTV